MSGYTIHGLIDRLLSIFECFGIQLTGSAFFDPNREEYQDLDFRIPYSAEAMIALENLGWKKISENDPAYGCMLFRDTFVMHRNGEYVEEMPVHIQVFSTGQCALKNAFEKEIKKRGLSFLLLKKTYLQDSSDKDVVSRRKVFRNMAYQGLEAMFRENLSESDPLYLLLKEEEEE